MAKHRTRSGVPWLPLMLTACASSPSGLAGAPAQYSALPQDVALRAEFTAAADLQAVQVPCLQSEPPDPNAVDDNCDGIIDDTQTGQLLSVAIAYPQQGSDLIRILVRSERAETSQEPLPEDAAIRSASVQVRRLDLGPLPAGRHQVNLSRQTQDGAAAALPVSVSLATAGVSRAYVVSLGAGESRSLGLIDVR